MQNEENVVRVIGIAGLSCSGKTQLARLFAEYSNAHIITVDDLGHEAIRIAHTAIIDAFGNDICMDDGTISRTRLAQKVFAHPQQLAMLERIVHPHMYNMVVERIAHCTQHYCIIDAAVLFNMNLHRLCSLVFWVHAPWYRRMYRAYKRDKHTMYNIVQRFLAQKKTIIQFYHKRSDITVIIKNIRNIQAIIVKMLVIVNNFYETR